MIDPHQTAFPAIHIHHYVPEDGKESVVVPRWHGGLTKREYFAAVALQGLLSRSLDCNAGLYSKTAVHLADTILEELDK